MLNSEYILLPDGTELQYTIRGTGIPILVFHGGHSNCFEEFGYRELLESGCSLITPSRPGYGDTSRELGESFAKACSAYVMLLDELELEQVHVLAISAGGPSGIYFAAHYPERVRTLTLQSAVTDELLSPTDKAQRMAVNLFRPGVEKFTWKLMGSMSKRFPAFILKQMAPSFSTLSWSEVMTYLKEEDVEAFCAMNNRQRSGHGFMIDLAQSRLDLVGAMQNIKCPTLIMHSKHDRTVPLKHAHRANAHISHSQLCILDTWGHLIWIGKGSEQVASEYLAFIYRNEVSKEK